MSETAYPQLTIVEDAFKSMVWDNLVEAGLTAFFAYFTFLNIPVVRQTIRYLATSFSDFLFANARLFLDVTAIKIVNSAAKSKYDTELLRLKIISLEKGNQSNEYKAARENAKAALAKFVHFGAV